MNPNESNTELEDTAGDAYTDAQQPGEQQNPIVPVLEEYRAKIGSAFIAAVQSGADPYSLARISNLQFTGTFASMVASNPEEQQAYRALQTSHYTAGEMQSIISSLPQALGPCAPVGA